MESQQQYASNNYAANQGDDGAAPDIIGMLCAALCAGINGGGGGGGNAPNGPSTMNGGGGGGYRGNNGDTDGLEGLIQTQPTTNDYGECLFMKKRDKRRKKIYLTSLTESLF